MMLHRGRFTPAAVAWLALLAGIASLLLAGPGAASGEAGRLHHRAAAAAGGGGGGGDEDFYRLFMVKRMLRNRMYNKRAGDFDRLMNQLEKLNRDSVGANADSMIFRLKKRRNGGVY